MTRRDRRGGHKKLPKLSADVPESALQLQILCTPSFIAAAGQPEDPQTWTFTGTPLTAPTAAAGTAAEEEGTEARTAPQAAGESITHKAADHPQRSTAGTSVAPEEAPAAATAAAGSIANIPAGQDALQPAVASEVSGAAAEVRALKLASWQLLADLLSWFASGASADSEAALVFPASLTKELRAQVHTCVSRHRSLQSVSQGVGEERHVRVVHASAVGGGTTNSETSRNSKEDGYVLYKLAQQEELTHYSRDEVTELLQQGNLPDDLKAVKSGAAYQEQQAIKALCLAASCGEVEQVKLLLAAHPALLSSGVQELSSRGGSLPLHLAAAAGQEEVLQLLLAAGADVHAVNGAGLTALQVAQHNEECTIEALLLQAGAVDQQQDAWQDPVLQGLQLKDEL